MADADRTLIAGEGRWSSIYPSKCRPRRTKHPASPWWARVEKHEELWVPRVDAQGHVPSLRPRHA